MSHRDLPTLQTPPTSANDPAEIERGLAAACDLFREIHHGWEERPLTPRRGWYDEDPLADTLREDGVGIAEAIEEFRRWILPGALGSPDPRYMGLVNSSPLPAGPLADLLVSALDNNCGAEHQGPSGAAAEREIVRLFGRLFLERDDASGLLLSGGSYATLHAILLARARAFPEWESRGPGATAGAPVLYVSEATHFSGARAGAVAGLGREGVHAVPTRGRGSMDPDALRATVRKDRADGRLPFAVVATAGTTGTGALDPLDRIADVTEQEGLWLHVDACYGGAARLIPEFAPRFRGMERADSVAVDPHKWFFLPLACSLVLTPRAQGQANPFAIDNSYIPGGGELYPYQRGIATSRRGMALTLWTTLRAHGLAVIRRAVAENIRLTRRMERRLEQAGFEVLPDGELSVACARWVPDGPGRMDAAEVDALQGRIAEAVIEADRGWFATVRHDGRTWMRLNMLNLETTEAHVDSVADAIETAAARLAPGSPAVAGRR